MDPSGIARLPKGRLVHGPEHFLLIGHKPPKRLIEPFSIPSPPPLSCRHPHRDTSTTPRAFTPPGPARFLAAARRVDFECNP